MLSTSNLSEQLFIRPLFTFVFFALLINLTFGQELKPRAAGPVLNYDVKQLEQCDHEWLQVKFVEGSDLVIQQAKGLLPNVFVDKTGKNVDAVNELLTEAIDISPTFPGDRQRFKVYKARGEAKSGAEGPDLGLWYNVRFHGDQENLAAKLNELNEMDIVEIAHPVPRVEPASFISGQPLAGDTPDFSGSQGYLYNSPLGLNAPAAWALTGGRGAGVKFIDVERGWYRNHEDFNQANFFFSGQASNPGQTFDHGTAVLGEVIGDNNGFGVTGFASDAQWGTVAYISSSHPLVAQYFLEAAEALDPGDVWLIEIQMFPGSFDATPMEYLQANFDAIWTSSFSLGVVCVEAGANGGQDLDSAAFGGVFNRDLRDSGAILVAAGSPSSLTRLSFSNYGSRMDAHAWGSSIVTTGYGDLQDGVVTEQYTSGFGGTSGASPMIVGTVLCVQGVHKANTGEVLLPLEIRQLITDTGTPHTSSTEIGPRPNIGAAIDALPQTINVNVASYDVTRGIQTGGTVSDLSESDDSDLSIVRNNVSIDASVWVEIDAVSLTESPSAFTFTMESSVFARSTVNQRIDLYDYQIDQFVEVDSRTATAFLDSVVDIDATGDLARFVEPGTGNIKSRLRYDSLNPRQRFSANIDQAIWTISN